MSTRVIILLLLISFPVLGQRYKTMRMHAPVTAGGGAPEWTNLVSWWEMDETSGGTAEDSYGSDDGTVYNATQGANGITFDGTGDSVSITGRTFTTGTIYLLATPDGDGTCDLLGGDEGALKLSMWSAYALRALVAGSAGTSVTSIALTDATENFVSVVVYADSIVFGINGTYESETWTETASENTTQLGASYYDLNEFVGTMRRVVFFSDQKTRAYTTAFYNSGSYTSYEDGDPL